MTAVTACIEWLAAQGAWPAAACVTGTLVTVVGLGTIVFLRLQDRRDGGQG